MRHTKPSLLFNLVYTVTLTLTIGAGGTSLWLISQPQITARQKHLLQLTISTWTMSATSFSNLVLMGSSRGREATHDKD